MIIDWKTDSLHYESKIKEITKKIRYRCPICKRKENFIRHGYYVRNVICWLGRLVERRLRILRVLCTICMHTHAVLPCDVIPHKIYTTSYYRKMIRLMYIEKKKVSDCITILEVSFNQVYRIVHKCRQILTWLKVQLLKMLYYAYSVSILKRRTIQHILYYSTLIVNSRIV